MDDLIGQEPETNTYECFPLAFAALNFAHRSFVAFPILALAAADITCFFLPFFRLPPLAASRPRIFLAAIAGDAPESANAVRRRPSDFDSSDKQKCF